MLYHNCFPKAIFSRVAIPMYLIWNPLYEHFRCWTEDGIFSGRGTNFSDIDDTSMGFRLLRLHGYDMSPGEFEVD